MTYTHPLDLPQSQLAIEGSRELEFFAVGDEVKIEPSARGWRCLSSVGTASSIGGCAFSLSTYACLLGPAPPHPGSGTE